MPSDAIYVSAYTNKQFKSQAAYDNYLKSKKYKQLVAQAAKAVCAYWRSVVPRRPGAATVQMTIPPRKETPEEGLQRGGDALLVVELLVDRSLRRVRPRRHLDVHLEPRRQRAQQLDADAQPDQRRHRAVRDRRREADVHAAARVVLLLRA